jgi:multicomponent Na+:H+ antiporter subunit B
MILFAVVFGLKEGGKRMGPDISVVLGSFVLVYVLIGLLGILMGYNFLSNRAAGIPLGRPGDLISGGTILALDIVIGLWMASTGKTLFYSLAGKDGEK